MDTLKKALAWPLVVSASRYCELCVSLRIHVQFNLLCKYKGTLNLYFLSEVLAISTGWHSGIE